jgi:hypothetical protein
MKELRKEGIAWNYKAGTIRCMAHVIQLAVNQFLGVLKSLAKNEAVNSHLSAKRRSQIKPDKISFSNTFAKVSLSKDVSSSCHS